jgi:gamma-glutamyl phosphate reductase
MSKSGTVKHMSADGEDRFEEALEGKGLGTMRDWKMDLGLQILKVEKAMAGAKVSNPNVHNMLEELLITSNVALRFLAKNPKAANQIGSEGGLDAIIAYLTKNAIEDAARAETQEYSDMLKPHLPGVKLNAFIKAGLRTVTADGSSSSTS